MQASTSLMVPEKHLARVAGLNQAMGGAVSIMSPPVGALLLEILPLHGIMAIDVFTAAFAIVPLFFVRIPRPRRETGTNGMADRRPNLWSDMHQGLGYVWNWPGLLALCAMAMLLNFSVYPAMSLVPILVTDHFVGGVAFSKRPLPSPRQPTTSLAPVCAESTHRITDR